MQSTKRLISDIVRGVVALALNRLELFGLELREEQQRFFALLALFLFGTLMTFMAGTLLLVTVLLLTPAAVQPWLCLGLGLLSLLLAFICLVQLKTKLAKGPAPFAVTRQELKKDCGIR
ncbi:MAG: phage holin family protein [Desulfopila sp.]